MGGFRPPLDISEMVQDYRSRGFLPDQSGAVDGDANLPVQRSLRPSQPSRWESPLAEDPYRVYVGPEGCSTCTDVALATPAFAWDVNRWYRTLGVPWPYTHVPSGSLAKYYLAVDGQSDARATYYLKRLLDKATRAAYDAAPLGELFLDDDFVQQEIKNRAQVEASRRSQTQFADAEQVMDEWGYALKPDDVSDSLAQALDEDPFALDDRPTPESSLWAYSYWVWRAHTSRGPLVTGRLGAWQSLLVSALSQMGHRTTLRVGVMGKTPQEYAIGRSGGLAIVYLNESATPTADLARRAAAALAELGTHETR